MQMVIGFVFGQQFKKDILDVISKKFLVSIWSRQSKVIGLLLIKVKKLILKNLV